MERNEQLAEAYLKIAQADHYMVGLVEVVTDDELEDARQILISGVCDLEYADIAGETAELRAQYDLALDLIENEQKRRLQAASAPLSRFQRLMQGDAS